MIADHHDDNPQQWSFNYSQYINKHQISQLCNENAFLTNQDLPTLQDHVLSEKCQTNTQMKNLNYPSRKAIHINNYPTKNCLPFFKSAHFSYLKYMNINYKKYAILLEKKQKNGMTRIDFVHIYSELQLRPTWQRMFDEKFIYQYLMLSRTEPNQKKIFQQKVKVFETAFHRLKFDQLNYN